MHARTALAFALTCSFAALAPSLASANPLKLCDPNEVRPRAPDWLPSLMKQDPLLLEAMRRAPELRFQVLVGEVIKQPGRASCIRQTSFRVGAEYTYPASSIKMVGAIAAVRRMQEVQGWTLDRDVTIGKFEKEFEGQSFEISPGTTDTMRKLLDDTLIISSNMAFNSLYDIAGREVQNQMMLDAGLDSVRLWHRLSQTKAPDEAHAWIPPVYLMSGEAKQFIHGVNGPAPELDPTPAPRTDLGVAYVDPKTGETVDGPMDFSKKNYASLYDLQAMVVAVARPELFEAERPFGLSSGSLSVLRDSMGKRPEGETEAERLAAEARFKPLSPGVTQALGDRSMFTYVNKAGRAYGFHLDSAYIQHSPTRQGFFVAVTMWPNENQVLNDNTYEYDTFSYPAMVGLGRVLSEELLPKPKK